MAITVPILSEWNKTALDKAQKDIEKFGDKAGKAFNGLAKAGRKVAVGIGAVGAAVVVVGSVGVVVAPAGLAVAVVAVAAAAVARLNGTSGLQGWFGPVCFLACRRGSLSRCGPLCRTCSKSSSRG